MIGRWSRFKVPPDYHVSVEGVAYSAPYRLIGQRIDIHRSPALVSIFHDGVRVAAHPAPAGEGRGAVVTLDEHRPPHHRAAARLTPEALQAAAQAIGAATGPPRRAPVCAGRPRRSGDPRRPGRRQARTGLRPRPAGGSRRGRARRQRHLVPLRRGAPAPRRDPAARPRQRRGAAAHGNVRGPGYYH